MLKNTDVNAMGMNNILLIINRFIVKDIIIIYVKMIKKIIIFQIFNYKIIVN